MKNYQQFFKKALAIQAQRQEKLSEAEKKEIAQQLGFTQADWQAVQESFQSHLDRGKEFLKRKNYKKAIVELEDALIIQPEHADTLAALAQTYLGEFQTKKRKHLKEKALQYAHECLQYDPKNEAAHQVIDFFNPNQHPSPYSRSQAPEQKSNKGLRVLYGVALFLGLLYSFWSSSLWDLMIKKMQNQAKHTTQNQNFGQQQQSNSQVKYENPLPFALQDLPKDLARKYKITQKDSTTWLLSSKKGLALFELILTENKWWHPVSNNNHKKVRYYADLQFELKTLCDSIRFDALFFTFQVIDKQGQVLQQEDSIYVEQRSSYDRWMYFPKNYFFRAGESNALYFRYTTKEVETQSLEKDHSLRPAKIALHIQSLQTARPPTYRQIALPVANSHKYVEFYALKEGFIKDPGSPYHIHFWALKIRNKHPKRAIKALGLTLRYYGSNKQLIKEGGDWLIHNLTAPLAAGTESTYKLRTHLGENTYTTPPVVIAPKDIDYKEVAIQNIEWE